MRLLYTIIILSAITLIPISLSYSTSSSNSSPCLGTIEQTKNQTEALDSQKVMNFVVNNSPDFKSLSHQYQAMWVATNYDWNTDLSACTTQLKDITVTFELSTPTAPFAGMAHVTVDPLITKVTGIKMDIPNTIVPPTCTDKTCRVAHGIPY